jgi:hypothetical protein
VKQCIVIENGRVQEHIVSGPSWGVDVVLPCACMKEFGYAIFGVRYGMFILQEMSRPESIEFSY